MTIEDAIYKIFLTWEQKSEQLTVDDLIEIGLQTDEEKAKSSAEYFLFVAENIGVELKAKKVKPFIG